MQKRSGLPRALKNQLSYLRQTKKIKAFYVENQLHFQVFWQKMDFFTCYPKWQKSCRILPKTSELQTMQINYVRFVVFCRNVADICPSAVFSFQVTLWVGFAQCGNLIFFCEIMQHFAIFSLKITKNKENCHSQISRVLKMVKREITIMLS